MNPFELLNRRETIDASTMVSITETGKKALNEAQIRDMRWDRMLTELDQHSPQPLGSLSRNSQMNINVGNKVAQSMRRAGLIRFVDFNKENG